MKRTLCLFWSLFVFFFLLTACAGQSFSDSARANFALPFERDVLFSFGETTGKAHLCLTENSLSVGISDGTLEGVVATVNDEKVQILYGGMDVSLSPESAAALSDFRKIFPFLQTQSFRLADAIPEESDEQIAVFRFTDANNILTCALDRKSGALSYLCAEFGTAKISLRV